MTCSECDGAVVARGMCSIHYQRWWKVHGPHDGRRPVGARFWAKVNKNGPVSERRPDLGPCWLWTAGTTGSGYGAFSVDGRQVPAHRWAYETEVGPIPDGHEVDHLCFVHPCVNPSHLDAVTPAENKRRSGAFPGLNARTTHCPQGHPYDEANTYVYDGKRFCRSCLAAKARRKRARLRDAA